MIKHEVLKICLDNKNFLDALHLLINEMFDKGKYSVQLKTELVKPIHKKEEIHTSLDVSANLLITFSYQDSPNALKNLVYLKTI